MATFKLQPNPTFKVKVAISVAGEKRSPEIEVEFKYLDKDEVKAFFDSLQGKEDVETLGEIVVGWSGVDTAFSAEALALLLKKYPAAGADLFNVFRRELLESKQKN